MGSKKITFVLDFAIVIVGCFLTAFATTALLRANGLTVSGITGLSITLESIINISYVYIYYVIVFLILIATLIFLGKKETGKIVLLAILFPTALEIFELIKFEVIISDPLLAILAYCIVGGIGVGLCYRKGYTFGGSDSIAKIIQIKVLPFLSLGNILLLLDLIILSTAAAVLGLEIALYAALTQVIFIRIIDYVSIGLGMTLYKLEIISSKHVDISRYILDEIGRGVTKKTITGAFTDEEKTQISCVCSPKESAEIRKYIISTDKSAFMEIIPVYDVWGGRGKRFKKFD